MSILKLISIKLQSMQLARRQNPSSFINLFEVGQISIFYKVKNMKNISHVQNLNILVDILLAHVQCPLGDLICQKLHIGYFKANYILLHKNGGKIVQFEFGEV